MSKRKWRRERGVAGGKTARERAEAAVRAGDAHEAERWARLAERLAKAPAPIADEEEEDHETAMRRIAQKLADFRRDQETCAAIARSYDLRWWEERWNEVRADWGLEPLPLTPLLHKDLIRNAQADPQEDWVTRTLRRFRARGLLAREEGAEDAK